MSDEDQPSSTEPPAPDEQEPPTPTSPYGWPPLWAMSVPVGWAQR